MSSQNSIDPFNSSEFASTKSTFFQLVYGKWTKFFNTKFSYLYLVKIFAIYCFWYLDLFAFNTDKISRHLTEDYTKNLLLFMILNQALNLILYGITVYLLSYKFYSVKKVIPESAKIFEEKYQTKPRLLDYKLIFSNGLKYNRAAFLIASVICLVIVFIKENPLEQIFQNFGSLSGFTFSDLNNEFGYILHRYFSQLYFELNSIFRHFIEYELILLTPILLTFLNTRSKHIIFGVGAIYLKYEILHYIVTTHPRGFDYFNIIYNTAEIALIILWIVGLRFNYILQKQLNSKVKNSIDENNTKPVVINGQR